MEGIGDHAWRDLGVPVQEPEDCLAFLGRESGKPITDLITQGPLHLLPELRHLGPRLTDDLFSCSDATLDLLAGLPPGLIPTSQVSFDPLARAVARLFVHAATDPARWLDH
jgi:hypothetical protein